MQLYTSLYRTKQGLKNMFGNSVDFYTKDIDIEGFQCCICMFENLSSIERLWIMMLDNLSNPKQKIKSPAALYDYITRNTAIPIEKIEVASFEDAQTQLTAGVSLILIDGFDKAIVISTQSMQFRSVQETSGEGNLRGSREGFTELLRVNISLIRRLIRTDELYVETMTLGEKTKTDIALCYNGKLCPQDFLSNVKNKLKTADIVMLLDTGYLAPHLQKGFSFFSSVGYTERPDTACAKVCEGKLVILANGTPFALIVPYFFSENFQSMDDYSQKAYFASFIRTLKYFAFFLAIMLPGIFVSVANFTPELFPPQLLYRIAAAEQATPLPLFLEAVLMIILLEIVREAGLRLPKAIGHSVSLVAALIVGDAAVSAGIVGTPIVIVTALTAICTFVVPSLYEPITVLRILFVFAGGILGPIGIVGLFTVMLVNICGMENFGFAYTSPYFPFSKGAFSDGLFRAPLKSLSKNNFNISQIKKENEK